MFAKLIEITPNKDNTDSHPIIVEKIGRYICSLKNNGQILSELSLVKADGKFLLHVTTPKADSLDERFNSEYSSRDRAELNKCCTVTVQDIGENVYSEEYCACEKRTVIEMETYDEDIDSPFICCNCGKPIALYELPYLDSQGDHYCIVNWQNAYRATDELWLDSLNDKFTANQLTNPNSKLNRLGKTIAYAMSEKTGAKVYLNIFDDNTDKIKYTSVDGRKVRICPSCGEPMRYFKPCDDYEIYVCDDCSLSSELPNSDEE